MVQAQESPVTDDTGLANWRTGTLPQVLETIHDQGVNIAIYERDIRPLEAEINRLLGRGIAFTAYGSGAELLLQLAGLLGPETYPALLDDMARLVDHFERVTGSSHHQLMLKTVDTDMCRRFHTDINDLRMLCTYHGPGTLWLTNDNINAKALESRCEQAAIARDEALIRQASAGAVLLLKGALYPGENSRAVVHRSPGVEHNGQKRLLLRIDTENSVNIWK